MRKLYFIPCQQKKPNHFDLALLRKVQWKRHNAKRVPNVFADPYTLYVSGMHCTRVMTGYSAESRPEACQGPFSALFIFFIS